MTKEEAESQQKAAENEDDEPDEWLVYLFPLILSLFPPPIHRNCFANAEAYRDKRIFSTGCAGKKKITKAWRKKEKRKEKHGSFFSKIYYGAYKLQ